MIHRLEPVIVLFDGGAGAPDFFAQVGDMAALLLQLTVETFVGFCYLAEIAANVFGHGRKGGVRGFLRGASLGEIFVRNGDQSCDVGEKFEELQENLRPHEQSFLMQRIFRPLASA